MRERLLDAVESVGINDAPAERLRQLKQDKNEVLRRLQMARIDAGPIHALPDFFPRLVKRRRQQVQEIGSLATNAHSQPFRD